ncbi:glycoside hydrolase superfamily [Amylocarpus encephaloides]|uniref:glucan 1,3-beta-glucosidase n=1 Tax=Amylocarpus encephaloides TaxID=45428 RepID=A0A9P7YLV8_9HELO|nr:glycoside hydrolase superfamily [Amylocarpus encephaloides]
MLLSTLLAAFAVGSVTAAPSTKRSVNFAWGSEPVRGLNLGGWLVLEPWITPSLFQSQDQSLGIIDELTLSKKLGNTALNVLKPHWDSWVTLADFQKISGAGFNTVRIPVGYWAYATYDGEPYTQGQAEYIDKAIEWARQTDLKVMIDLHGAPLSQNGFDNSGQKMATPGWQGGDSVSRTLEALNTISTKYAQAQYQDVVSSIQLLNEPLSSALNFDSIKDFYRSGYDQVRKVSDTPVVIHDGFITPSTWNGFLSTSDNGAFNVVVDHHEYQVFSQDTIKLQPWEHRQLVCNNVGSYSSNSDKWVMVSEWTAAMTDCAPALNGYGVGARYDNSYPDSSYVGSCVGKCNVLEWTQTMKDDTRGYIEAQISTFESHTKGWVFWNFKTESAHEWDAFALLDAGIFPQPLTDQKFSSICS